MVVVVSDTLDAVNVVPRGLPEWTRVHILLSTDPTNTKSIPEVWQQVNHVLQY